MSSDNVSAIKSSWDSWFKKNEHLLKAKEWEKAATSLIEQILEHSRKYNTPVNESLQHLGKIGFRTKKELKNLYEALEAKELIVDALRSAYDDYFTKKP